MRQSFDCDCRYRRCCRLLYLQPLRQEVSSLYRTRTLCLPLLLYMSGITAAKVHLWMPWNRSTLPGAKVQ